VNLANHGELVDAIAAKAQVSKEDADAALTAVEVCTKTPGNPSTRLVTVGLLTG